jgi:hypothetical protein
MSDQLFTDKQTLIEMAISQIKNDLNQGDATALEELLSFVPVNRLSGFLSEPSDQFVWREIQVHWCDAHRWVVRGVLPDGSSEYLDDLSTQVEAIDEAEIYAFDTSCGPKRAPIVKVFTKGDDIKKIIEPLPEETK